MSITWFGMRYADRICYLKIARFLRRTNRYNNNVYFALTSLFKNMKYICIKIKAILVAGVKASKTL